MSEEQLSRKERERLQHKKQILETALRLFSEKGFHNVAMQEIAQASEFSVGTLYNFFESKETLFEEMAHNCGQQVIGALETIIDRPGNEIERLRAFIRYQPKLLEEHAEFIKLYVSEFGRRGVRLSKDQIINELSRILDLKVEQLIRDGISKGMFRSVDPAVTAKALGSVIETLAFEKADNFEKTEVIDIFKKVEQLFLEGLLLPGELNND